MSGTDPLTTMLVETINVMHTTLGALQSQHVEELEIRKQTRECLAVMNTRLAAVEIQVRDAAKTWSTAKRVVVGISAVLVGAASLNWAGVVKGVTLLFHP